MNAAQKAAVVADLREKIAAVEADTGLDRIDWYLDDLRFWFSRRHARANYLKAYPGSKSDLLPATHAQCKSRVRNALIHYRRELQRYFRLSKALHVLTARKPAKKKETV